MEFIAVSEQIPSILAMSIGEVFVHFGSAIKDALNSVPMSVARGALALALLALAVWCLVLPRQYVMEGARRTTGWNDLRRWAALALFIQILLYLCL